VGQVELDLIESTPRLDWQPIFYPVLNREYAVQIARDWNTKDAASGYVVGYVLRFESARSTSPTPSVARPPRARSPARDHGARDPRAGAAGRPRLMG
jgi:hypothetical protein